MRKNKVLSLASLMLSVSMLAGCTFLSTSKEDMATADSEMADQPLLAGHYEDYTPERFSELKGSEKFVLFFHADWCPTCRALEADIKKNLGVLHNHVLLEADYDQEAGLKKQYGVMVQSTVTFFNADGSVADQRINPPLAHIEEFLQ